MKLAKRLIEMLSVKGRNTLSSRLEKCKAFLLQTVYPVVNEIDINTDALLKVFQQFRDNRYFNMYVPKEYGGEPFSLQDKIAFQEMMGRWGGAFSFLQAQTGTGAWIIANGSNQLLKERYLSALSKGEVTIGNSASYMKPHSAALLRGVKSDNQYVISGKINFASGYQYFDKLVIGFKEASGWDVFALIPFNNIAKEGIQFSTPVDSLSMVSLNTVAITFNDYKIDLDDIIVSWDGNYFYSEYRKFPPYAYPLGIANEALMYAKQSIERTRVNHVLMSEYSLLYETANDCQSQLERVLSVSEQDALFARIMRVASSALQLALMICGGTALLKHHSLQRLYRELPIWCLPRSYPEVIQAWSAC